MVRAIRPRRGLIALLAAAALLVLVAAAGAAADPAPAAAGVGARSQATQQAEPQGSYQVVAKGLNNPRGLAFGHDGALYVAEAGKGGAGPCVTGPEGGEQCFGKSGSVTRVTRNGQWRVVRSLPSLANKDGSNAGGPSDVAFGSGRFFTLVGNPGGGPESRERFGDDGAAFGRLLRILPTHRMFVADFPRFEAANNPDKGAGAQPGLSIDSNPNAVAARHGWQVVADAGGNDLLAVSPSGKISVLGVFPVRMVPAPSDLGLPPGAKIPMQAVPDSVTRGPDGAWYVGELTGFPFQKGAARVWRVVPGKKPTVYAGGFTNIIDLAFDRHGRLNVLEIAHNGLASGDLTGALLRIGRNGERTVIASKGLVAPTGLAIGPDGSFYVSNFGIFPGTNGSSLRSASPGGLPGTGQVIRIPRR